MKIKLLLGLLFILASCSNDDSLENVSQNINLLIGDWQEIEKGTVYDDGGVESSSKSCDNKRVLHLFEFGSLLYDSWSLNGEECVFDFTRRGEYRKDSTSEYPEANYYVIFFRNLEDDEEKGFVSITVSDDILTWKFGFRNTGEGFEYSYRKYKRI